MRHPQSVGGSRCVEVPHGRGVVAKRGDELDVGGIAIRDPVFGPLDQKLEDSGTPPELREPLPLPSAELVVIR